MPRTKAPKKTIKKSMKEDVTSTTAESFQGKDINEVLNDVDSLTSKQSARLEQSRELNVDEAAELFRNIRMQTNKVIGNMTVQQYWDSIEKKENILPASVETLIMSSVSKKNIPVQNRNISAQKKTLSSTLKNLPSTGKTMPSVIRTRKRSSSDDSRLKPVNTRKRSSSVDSHRMPPPNSCDRFRTPSNQSIPSLPMVTPKINPNMPLSILRRPNQGECALSLDGSPLLVSGVMSDSVASVSVPLPDGRIISILATEGIEGADLNLDAETRQQLMMLNRNLTKCLEK